MRRRCLIPKPVVVKGACPYCGGDVSRGYKHREGFQKCYNCHRTSWWSWWDQFPELQQGKMLE